MTSQKNAKDPLPKTTLASFAEAFGDEDRGGRFKPEAPTHVIGSTPFPRYPELPASSPSHHDPVPDEGPLGLAVGDHPAVEAASVAIATKSSKVAKRAWPPRGEPQRCDPRRRQTRRGAPRRGILDRPI
jgi:hypothetical protein